jgi:serine/threonine protein kinase
MKTLDKWEMQERNKVARVLTEESVLSVVDHPFVATCYCTLQTDSHLHFVMGLAEGGELYGLLNAQPRKRLKVCACVCVCAVLCARACACVVCACVLGVRAGVRCAGHGAAPCAALVGACRCFCCCARWWCDTLQRTPTHRHSRTLNTRQEAHVKFYGAEVLLALQYLHLLGYIYR